MRIVYFLLIIAAFISCNNKQKQTIPSSEMKLILWEMSNADELTNEMVARDTTVKNKKQYLQVKQYEQVFAVHNITKEKFYSSLQFYQSRPDQYKILLDSVVAYGNRIKNANSNTPEQHVLPKQQ
jgi:uncharacterized lipoprotein NlpE involved in copper resistance